MAVTVRRLDPAVDRERGDAFWPRIADYVRMERDAEPTPALARALTREFFTAAPPGTDPADGPRLGLFVGDTLQGIVELAFGFPEPDDAYLGIRSAGLDRGGRPDFLDRAAAREHPRVRPHADRRQELIAAL